MKKYLLIVLLVGMVGCKDDKSGLTPGEHLEAAFKPKSVNVDSLIEDAYQKGINDEYERWEIWQRSKVHEASLIVLSAAVNNKNNCCDLAHHILNEYDKALKVYYKTPEKLTPKK